MTIQDTSSGWKAFFMLCGLIIFGIGIFQNSLARTIGGLGLLFLSSLIK
jgi:hypothetical protein